MTTLAAAQRLVELRNALLDWEIVVDERRLEVDAAVELLNSATAARDEVIRRLADLLVEVTT